MGLLFSELGRLFILSQTIIFLFSSDLLVVKTVEFTKHPRVKVESKY